MCLGVFNLYVNDLTDVHPTEVNCHQYAKDITIYSHSKPSELLWVVGRRCRLSTWSFRCNLALHPKKTKVMPLLSTPPDVTNSWTRRTLHPSLRKWKESPASFNFPPTWYGSARKRQLEKRNKLQISSCYGTLIRS